MSRWSDPFDYLQPANRRDYYRLQTHIMRERGLGVGDTVVTLGATLSLTEGSHFSGPVMMTTWELDGYPLMRVEQTNPGERLAYDDSDVWAYWINSDHAWRLKS